MLYNITGIGGDSEEMVLCYAEMMDYFRTSVPASVYYCSWTHSVTAPNDSCDLDVFDISYRPVV